MRRIVAALGAGAFGQAVNVLIQLLSLPAFLAVWSPTEYGVWLMLSAMTAYMSLADVGLVTAVGNELTMANGRGDGEATNRLFQSALAFMLAVCGGSALLSILAGEGPQAGLAGRPPQGYEQSGGATFAHEGWGLLGTGVALVLGELAIAAVCIALAARLVRKPQPAATV